MRGDSRPLDRAMAHEMFHGINFMHGIFEDAFTQNSPLFDLSIENFSMDPTTGDIEVSNIWLLAKEAFQLWKTDESTGGYAFAIPSTPTSL